MMGFINNIYFWIIAFFVVVVIMILMFIMLLLIKMKTHAMIELKAFIKKCPVSMFFDDGKFFDMKAIKVETGIIQDDEYGVFVRHAKNTYLGKRTRNVYDAYNLGFTPGINMKAAEAAQELRRRITDENDYLALGDLIADGTLPDASVDCIRGNVSVAPLKDLFNLVEPHNINSSVEKKVAKHIKQFNNKGSGQYILTFIAVFGALIGGYILLKMFVK